MLPYKIYQSPESAHNAAAPPFPTQQLFVLGTYLDLLFKSYSVRDLTRIIRICSLVLMANGFCSTVPNMRAHCIHVHFPIQLLHDTVLQDYH